jgi:hypothetical protein
MNARRFQARKARRVLAVTALVAFTGIGAAMPSSANESYNPQLQEDCAAGAQGSWLELASEPSEPPAPRLAPGELIGPYHVDAWIGSGGMGDVYRATDDRLKRIVAIKVSTGRLSARFEREARAIAALNHPNICQIYDIGPNSW